MVAEPGGNRSVASGVEVGGGIGVGVDGDDDEVGLHRDGFAVEEIRLSSVHNFRDVAGPGYALRPSGSMTRGVVFRSTALSVGEEDLGVLERLGVTAVVDLRTGAEIERQPDVVPAGAEYVPIDVLGGHTSAATLTTTGLVGVEEARREMAETYERFVLGDHERGAFGRAMSVLAESSGPAIVHCTAGKDRTGWVSALLQLLVGVREEDVVADYLLTREMSADFVAAIRAHVQSQMPEQLEAVEVLIGVEEANLRRSLDALAREFGDARRYLVEGAGVDAEVVDELTARLRSR
ncbi:tyrosine protein phosphatase [Dietzia sp. HMSC21D01]|uniref:Protein-tyrosine phosphatase n=1 Tax=Dietzia cinnamea TaxID=321318 RepID=A0A4R3ZNA4_9ACTN|nr:tyrosine-protein phosphatase [Dietzia cinnamea]KZO60225.1 tyrosine protein phosphatase [Dietzia maris]OFS15982.1 tyrosine protein phosphatase [Dietzia sp. HMSC21D01]MBM7230830.1 tyrosine-protein phosphatase [Dietzia cinnamea]MCT1885568.1 tyrosine-protein phosphatase [Dietzia cinnamea]PWD95952.1 protein-tyrosine-phosphatase [Dietzia maris]